MPTKLIMRRMAFLYFSTSLGCHFLLVLGGFFLSQNPKASFFKQEETKIEVELIYRQIVEQDKTDSLEDKESEKLFLSAVDKRVKIQTKASRIGSFQNQERGGRSFTKKIGAGLGPAWTLSSQNSQTSQTDDFLKNIREGDQTHLNTKSYVFYTYYHQIRMKLRPIWNRRIREAYYKGLAYNKQNLFSRFRMTKLIVLLDQRGAIFRIEVVQSSGSSFVDQAAVESFYEVAPFPNPPQQIQNEGQVRFEWSFIVEA